MPNACAGLHSTEQRKRLEIAVISLGHVRSQLQELAKNPEALVSWEIAAGNAATLLNEINEAVAAERLARLDRLEREFNNRTLFAGGVRRG